MRMTIPEALNLLDEDQYWRKFQVDYPECHLDNFVIQIYEVARDDPERIRNIQNEGLDRDMGWGTFRKLVEFVKDDDGMVPVKIHEDGTVEPKHVLWMSDTRAEIMEHSELFNKLYRTNHIPHKRILVNGLGLGMAVHGILTYKGVDHVDVVERNPTVARLVGELLPRERVTVHVGDAFDINWPPGTRWDFAWHDIWPSISDDNLPEMDALVSKYKRRTSWQACWQRKGCLKMKKVMDQARAGTLDPGVALDILGGKFHL